MSELVPVRDAAKEIGIGYTTLITWIHKQRVSAVRVGYQYLLTREEVVRAKGLL